MKQRKNICVLNLFLFLGSFVLFSFNGLASRYTENQNFLLNKHVVSKHGGSSTVSIQELSEENETELENGMSPISQFLPFFFSYFTLETQFSKTLSAPPHLFKPIQPIYLSVNNFRI